MKRRYRVASPHQPIPALPLREAAEARRAALGIRAPKITTESALQIATQANHRTVVHAVANHDA